MKMTVDAVEAKRTFPLTPALSRGERENVSQRLEEASSTRLHRAPPAVLPLPTGEGRGEGEADDRSPDPSPQRPTHPANRIILLGLGNDILTDDSIGLRVASEIRRRLDHLPNLTVAETTEMGLSLLDFIVGYDELVIVDAVQTHQAPPGFVHEIGGEALKTLPNLSPHFLGVGEVLALGRELGLPVPQRVRIFAVEVEDPFTVGTQLTSTLEAELPRIVDGIAAAIARM